MPRIIVALAALLVLSVTALAQQTIVIKEVVVRGNQNISADAVLAAMKLKVGSPFLQVEALQDEENIRSLGFFKDVKILSRPVSESECEVVVEIVEYPIVREVRVVGNTVVSTEKITETAVAIQPLERVYNLANGSMIREQIVRLYADEGYFVEFLQLGMDDTSPGTLTIGLLEPTINDIVITGLVRTDPKVLKRLIKSRPGQAYSVRLWRRDVEEVYQTQWFEDIKPSQTQADGIESYNLNLEVTEAKTGLITAGMALDPQSRLVGTLSYSDSNFRGQGTSVGINLSQATAGGGPSAEFAFGNRFYDSKDTSMRASIYSRVVYNFTGSGFGPISSGEGDKQFDERRTGGSVSFSRPHGEKHRTNIGFRAENIKTVNLNVDPDEDFIQQDGNLAILQLGYDLDTRHPTLEPWQGQLGRIMVEPGYSDITKIGGNIAEFTEVLGQQYFARTTLEYRQYWSKELPLDAPIDKPRPVWAFRARYGFISGTVPFYEQFFVGGSDSLRGYDNQRFWGKQSFLTSLEYRFPVQKSFNLVAFTDYGGAWGGYGEFDGFEQSSDARLRFGYGLGVAFRTPLGPIRVDFARNQEGQSRTHFTFGASF